MNKKKIGLIFLTLLIILSQQLVLASSNELHIQKELNMKKDKGRYNCFDVNDMYIALGFKDDQIDFYSNNNPDYDYLFSLVFQIDGGYSFSLGDKYINIIDYRKAIMFVYDFEGQKIDSVKVPNLDELHKSNQRRDEISLNSKTFKIEARFSGSKLVAIDNVEYIINESKDVDTMKMVMIFVIICIFNVAIILVVLAYVKVKRSKKT